MIFPYLYVDMLLKRLVIFSILSVSFLVAHASAINDDTAVSDTIRFDDGAWYAGQISDSLFNGYGKMFYADSTIYEGEWKDGLWDGKGEVFFPDGDYYKGEFKEHKFSGYGVYLYSDSSRYEGQWENGMFNGAGSMTYPDGSIYTGEWMNDRKHGVGVLYNAGTQSLLKGYFNNDVFMPSWSEPAPQIVSDGKEHLSDMASVFVSYGLNQILSFSVDYHVSDHFFAGGSLGFNTSSRRIGEVSETYDDETGEKNVLVEWNAYMDEVLTENTYNMMKLAAECGISLDWFSIGVQAGISLKNTIRNCRSLEHNDSYYEPGTLYYREKVTGARFAYDFFADMMLSRPKRGSIYAISVRTGYSNIDGFHIGAGLTF